MVAVTKKWCGFAVLTCGLVAAGCDRPVAEDAPTTRAVPAVEGQTAEERDFGRRPLAVGRDEPEAPTTAPASDVPVEVEIAGRMLPLPPAVLRLSADGTAALVADGEGVAGAPPNMLFLQMTPTTDGGRPWTRAVWTYQLTSNEDQATSGIFVGGPENQLRPVSVELEILRDPAEPQRATITFRGRFVPTDAPDALTATGFEVRAAFRVTVEGP